MKIKISLIQLLKKKWRKSNFLLELILLLVEIAIEHVMMTVFIQMMRIKGDAVLCLMVIVLYALKNVTGIVIAMFPINLFIKV